MIQLLRKLWFWFFPIDRERAIKIAAKAVLIPDTRAFKASEAIPGKINIYNMPNEPCWYVVAPWGDGMDGSMLRSSRIVIISRKTGRVLYDGSANDEG